jgi:hypothetical protein
MSRVIRNDPQLMVAARAFKGLLAKLSDSMRVTGHTLMRLSFVGPDLRKLVPTTPFVPLCARENGWIERRNSALLR